MIKKILKTAPNNCNLEMNELLNVGNLLEKYLLYKHDKVTIP